MIDEAGILDDVAPESQCPLAGVVVDTVLPMLRPFHVKR